MKNLLLGLCLSLLAVLGHADDPLNNLTALAESGDADAQYQLAQRYKKGEGVTQDDARAAEWFTKAADLGNAGAMVEMSYVYARGAVVPKDTCRSFQYVKHAAELGHTKAQYLLGLKYKSTASSCGGADSASSRVWLEKAAGQGSAEAASALGAVYFWGNDGFVKDDDKALFWLQRALAEESSRAGADKNFLAVDSAMYLAMIYARRPDDSADNRLNAAKWFYIAYKLYEAGGCMDKTQGSHSCGTAFPELLADMDKITKTTDPHDASLMRLEAFWQDFQHKPDSSGARGS